MIQSRKKSQTRAIIVIAVLLALMTILNVSLAYFTDSAEAGGSGNIKFGTIHVNTAVLDKTNTEISTIENSSVKFSLTATEVASMDDVKDTLRLSTVSTGQKTEPFYIRMSLSAQKNGSATSDVNIAISSTSVGFVASSNKFVSQNWTTGKDGKLYYSGIVDLATDGSQYIPLLITFDKSFGDSSFSASDTYTLNANIEVIQYANNGYNGWSANERPVSWPSNTTVNLFDYEKYVNVIQYSAGFQFNHANQTISIVNASSNDTYSAPYEGKYAYMVENTGTHTYTFTWLQDKKTSSVQNMIFGVNANLVHTESMYQETFVEQDSATGLYRYTLSLKTSQPYVTVRLGVVEKGLTLKMSNFFLSCDSNGGG